MERAELLSRVNGIKVFSATKMADRAVLGETITRWLRQTGVEILDHVVTQSSDSEYHCLSVTLFFRESLDSVSAL